MVPKNPPDIMPFGPKPNLYTAPAIKPPNEYSSIPDSPRNVEISVVSPLEKYIQFYQNRNRQQ